MIEARDLTRHFGDITAVDRISLRVPDGAVVALLGPNGAGKTTTVRMLAGLLAPSDGSASVAGCDVRSNPAGVRARVGLVTDPPGLYEQMGLWAYLDFFGSIYGLDAAARKGRISELLAFFELTEHRNRRMVGFSKGMKQKVALARALLHEPGALFLDEPTAGLDPLAARAVRDLIVGLKGTSRSIVLCTHDLAEAERLADEVIILRRGRVVAAGAPATLRAAASPDTLVRIALAAAWPAALAALSTIAGVTVPTVVDAPGAPAITYRAQDPRETNPPVIAQLAAAGARIISVDCETRTLEDVYAEMLGDERNAGAPPVATATSGER